MYALIVDGSIREMSPDPHIWTSEMDARDVSKIKGIEVGWTVNEAGKYAAPAPSVSILSVPTVTRAQAKIQLRRAGLRTKVEAIIAEAGEDAQDWYAEAGTWQRDHAYVNQIGDALKLKPEKIDDLFREAAKIDA